MTTIISNGSYLLADHRRTTSYTLSERLLKNEDGHPPTAGASDTADKLMVLKEDTILKIRDKRIIAYGLAGPVGTINTFNDIVKYGAGKDRQLAEVIRLLTSLHIRTVSIAGVFVLEDNTSVTMNKVHNVFTYENHKKDEVCYVGSGTRFLSAMKDLLPKNLHISDYMALACAVDKHTSPTYAVYGVKENHLYSRIDPGKEHILDRYKTLMMEMASTTPSIRRINTIIK